MTPSFFSNLPPKRENFPNKSKGPKAQPAHPASRVRTVNDRRTYLHPFDKPGSSECQEDPDCSRGRELCGEVGGRIQGHLRCQVRRELQE